MSGTTELEVHQHLSLDETAPIAPEPTTDVPAAAPERARSPRDEQMVAIYEARERKRGEELAYGERAAQAGREAADLADPEGAAERAAEERAAAQVRLERGEGVDSGAEVMRDAPPRQPRRAAEPEAAPAPMLHTVMVDGQAMQVTAEQLAHLASVGAVTNRAIHQYQNQQSQTAPVPQQRQVPPPQQHAVPAPQQGGLTDAEAAEFARKIQYGDQDETARVFKDLAERLRPAPVVQHDPNLIIQAAAQHAIQQIQLEENLRVIGNEYPDIFNEAMLTDVAVRFLDRVRKEDVSLGRSRPDLDAYRESCNRVRALFGRAGPQTPPAEHQSGQPKPAVPAALRVAPMEERQQRVRAAPSVPTAANRKVSAGQEFRPPSHAEVVERMRAQRGQPAMR